MPQLPPLPDLDWKPVIEHRTRIEYRDDRDFSGSTNDYQSRWDNRFRVGVDFTYKKTLSGQLRYQHNQSTFWTEPRIAADSGSNLLLGNVRHRDKGWDVTVGRQTVSKGDRRLVDASDFGQRPKVFDVLRVQSGKWDGMLGQVGLTSQINDRSRVGMASYQWLAGETMAFYKSSNDLQINHWTLDHRASRKIGKWQFAAEAALQSGKTGGNTLRSWFGHVRAQYAHSPATMLFTEANIASGGGRAGESNLFDPLYGTGHTPYGLTDLQGLRNMRHLEIGVRHQIRNDLTGTFSFNGFGLYSRNDGWYSTSGSINRGAGIQFRDPSGQSGNDVGHEWNLAFNWAASKRDTIQLEFAWFKPGNFVKKLSPGGDSGQFWGLASYSFRF